MKLFADEGVDRQVVDRLRLDGHETWYVAEMERGVSDDSMLETANRFGAILLTQDKDFGELVYRQGRINSGVLLLRLAGLTPQAKAEVARAAERRPERSLARRAKGFQVPRWDTHDSRQVNKRVPPAPMNSGSLGGRGKIRGRLPVRQARPGLSP